MSTQKLHELAKTIRSKNAGVNKITFDIIFREAVQYERVRRSGVLSPARMAALFGIAPERISDFVEYDPAFAIKFTIYRQRPSGCAGDGDIFGAQQYAPLLDLEIPA
jgi:hypothetical protein